LRTHNEDIKKAADTLGITLRKLQSKLKEYNV
ncbi:MAG: hypothetical protein KDK65_08105, partial [Chlamydiia bacterium]|nr:hypothetical protein [Chlamydiia bacterium]